MAQDKRAKLASIIDDHEFNFVRSMFYKTLDLNKGTIVCTLVPLKIKAKNLLRTLLVHGLALKFGRTKMAQ